jgi:hypothetical protein
MNVSRTAMSLIQQQIELRGLHKCSYTFASLKEQAKLPGVYINMRGCSDTASLLQDRSQILSGFTLICSGITDIRLKSLGERTRYRRYVSAFMLCNRKDSCSNLEAGMWCSYSVSPGRCRGSTSNYVVTTY